MRALCGAIITAAALIALGMTAQGIGARYTWVERWRPAAGEQSTSPNLKPTPDVEASHVKIHEMDNGLKLCLTLSTLALLVGFGITFVGLMYHHFRRFHEHLRAGPHAGVTTSHHITS
jgi:transposase